MQFTIWQMLWMYDRVSTPNWVENTEKTTLLQAIPKKFFPFIEFRLMGSQKSRPVWSRCSTGIVGRSTRPV
jgi:hypothetical protein